MKKLLFSLSACLLLFSASSFAEHTATYCGTLATIAQASKLAGASDRPFGFMKVTFEIAVGDPWEDQYETAGDYAEINDYELTTKDLNFLNSLKRGAKGDEFCIKGTWSGALGGDVFGGVSLSLVSPEKIGDVSEFSPER